MPFSIGQSGRYLRGAEKTGKWIFFGCIIASFLLLGWEWLKARKIIRSRDISYAFTNVMCVGTRSSCLLRTTYVGRS